ncbi:MAG: hypothetical protein IT529_23270 [Burkholderiales bacterium]|nr:hypothetical protein [Burkholderiales bacterium]
MTEVEASYTVLNPAGEHKQVPAVPLSARLAGLEGRTVYCISQIIGGADVFLKKIAQALPQYAPGVKTVFVHKTTAYMADDPALWSEIATKGHAVIYGCAA